jgi:FGGY-family pentulose kinase
LTDNLQAYFMGIDVGTTSARAGIFDSDGRMVGSANKAIQNWKPAPGQFEQSSDDIWAACCLAAKAAVKNAGIDRDTIKGIGFDATCSLVALDADDKPVSVSCTSRQEQNVIVWMDHRAIDQAKRINNTRHPVLRYVGGVISPEMQTPKLLWLKEKRNKSWRKSARFLDLPDFLTYRATGDDTRSLCTTVCKWTYIGQNGPDGAGWVPGYFNKIGLEDLVSEKFRRIGRRVRPIGEAVGAGLTAKAAEEMDLVAGTPVGVSAIDAHAGGLGLLGGRVGRSAAEPLEIDRRVALIGGTSSCHMAVSRKPLFIRGIWGPYYSAMVPGLWLTEGGQSATGALIDHIIDSHSASGSLRDEAARFNKTVYEVLNDRLEVLAWSNDAKYRGELTRDLHIQPDFHGNRSPLADATLKGAISGLTLSSSLDDLAMQYLAAIQAVAYGTRQIIEEMNGNGYSIDTIFATGGGTKNPVFLREHADITRCQIVLPKEPEAVLLGAAILGAVASRQYPNVIEAMKAMNSVDSVVAPSGGRIPSYHAAKYRVFKRLHSDFVAYRKLMRGV